MSKPVQIKSKNFAAEAMEKTTGLSKHAVPAAAEKPLKALGKKTGLDLTKHSLVEETHSHFHVRGPSGTFKVAKSGLSRPTIEKISAHFAEGGEAKGDAAMEQALKHVDRLSAAGMVQIDNPTSRADLAKAFINGTAPRELYTTPTPQGAAVGGGSGPLAQVSKLTQGASPPPSMSLDELANRVTPGHTMSLGELADRVSPTVQAPAAPPPPMSDVDRASQGRQANIQAISGGDRGDVPIEELGGQTPNDLEQAYGTSQPAQPSAASGVPSQAPTPVASAAAAPPPPQRGAAPGGMGDVKATGAGDVPYDPGSGIRASGRGQEAALNQQGGLEEQAGQEVYKAQTAVLAAKQSFAQRVQEQQQAFMQEDADLKNQIASSQIKPQDIFAGKDTSHKIMTAIGLILGGIGSGMTKGPNYALEIVNNAIQRDVEAQKANLGKLETMYSKHLEKGRTVQEAEKLAFANTLSVVQTMLDQAGAKYAGPIASAKIAQASAAIGAQVAQAYSAVSLQGAQTDLTRIQELQGQYAVASQRYMLSLMQNIGGGQGRGAQGSPGMSASPAAFIAPKTLALDAGNNLQTEPVTRTFLATNEKMQEEAQKYMAEDMPTVHAVSELQALVHKYPHGVIPQTELRGRIDALTSMASLEYMKAGAGINRLNRQELETIETKIIPKLSSMRALSGYEIGLVDKVAARLNEVKQQRFRTFFGGVNPPEVPEGFAQTSSLMGMKGVHPVPWTEHMPVQFQGR